MRGLYSLLVCFGVMLGGFAGPAAAIEIFGIKFFESEEPEVIDLIDPVYYDVTLTVTPEKRSVIGAISRSSGLMLNAERPALGRAGLLSSAKTDYSKILEALYRRGHYGGSVSILIDGQEASNLPLDVALPDRVPVQILVEAGPVYQFKSLNLQNPPKGFDAEAFGFLPNEAAFSETVGEAALNAVDGWRAIGYARADIGDVDVVADHAAQTIDVDIQVLPGQQARYGKLDVTGSERIARDFIIYMADLPKGAVFSGEDLAKARSRLLKLDTFSSVRIIEDENIASDGTLGLNIEVQDRKPRRLGAGVTINSLEGLGLEGFWLHRNMFGKAERLRFDVAVTNITSIDPHDYNWEIGVNYIKPGAITPDTDFNLTVTAERELTDTYDARELEISSGFATTFSDTLSGELNAVLARSFVRDDLGERDFITVGLEAGLAFDTRDAPLDAKEGVFLAASVYPFYEVEFGNRGLRTELEGRAYRALDEDRRFVLAGRLATGSLFGISSDETSNATLFFSGGGGSVRGYGFRTIGVDVPGTGTIGGLSVIEGSAELRARFGENWGLVGFYDVGLVDAEPAPDFQGAFRSSIGVGARFHTQFGPIRFDVARGLNRGKDDPVVGIYVGLGQAF